MERVEPFRRSLGGGEPQGQGWFIGAIGVVSRSPRGTARMPQGYR
jgi:hypothetical protein